MSVNVKRLKDVLADIAAERARQDRKWGEQHWPDGTKTERRKMADVARSICEQSAKIGSLSWYRILQKEFFEAGAEIEWPKLRAELIQVAAVCVAWIEDGDQRAALSSARNARRSSRRGFRLICSNCKLAGRYNTEACRVALPELREIWLERVEDAHAKCSDLGCGCQHQTGDGHLNPG